MSELVPLDLDWSTAQDSNAGERIRVLRAALGHTPASLTRATGVSSSSVTLWENGAWPGRLLQTLCKVLDVSPEALAAGAPLRIASGPFFRTQSTKSKDKVEEQTVSYARLVGELATYLDRRQGLELPELPTAKHELRDSPSEIAQAARKLVDLDNGPLANVIRAAERAGVIVVYGERIRYGSSVRVSIDAYSLQVGPWPIMVLTPKGDYYRQRWDVAHELGHLLLHRGMPDFGDFEHPANQFAAEFLMPKDAIINELPSSASRNLAEFRPLKERWGVSVMTLIYRAHELGVMSDQAFKDARGYHHDLRWQQREPGLMGGLEMPTLFSRVVQEHEQFGGQREEMIRESGIPTRLFKVMVATRPPSEDADNERIHVA